MTIVRRERRPGRRSADRGRGERKVMVIPSDDTTARSKAARCAAVAA